MENIKNQSTDNPDQTYDYIKEPLLFRNFRSNPINVHGVWNAVYVVKSKVDKFSNWEKIYNVTSATITADGNTYVSPVAKTKINNFLDYYFPFEAPVFIEKNLDLLLTEKLQKTADVNLTNLNAQPDSIIEKEVSAVDLTNTTLKQEEVENIKSPLDIKAQFEKLTQPISISNIPGYQPAEEKTISSIDLSNLVLDEIDATQSEVSIAKSNYDALVQQKQATNTFGINLENVVLDKEIAKPTLTSPIPLSNFSTSISSPIQKEVADIELTNLATTLPNITNVEKEIANIGLSGLAINKHEVVVQTKIADINLQGLVLNKEVVLPSIISPIVLENLSSSIPTLEQKEIENIDLSNLLVATPIQTKIQTEIANIDLQNLILNNEVIAPTNIAPVMLDNISSSISINTVQKETAHLELQELVTKQPVISNIQTEIADINLQDLAVSKEVVLPTAISPIVLENLSSFVPLAEQKEIADIELENLIAKQPVVIDTKKQIDDILLNDLLVTEPVATQTEIADLNLQDLAVSKEVVLPTAISPIVLENLSSFVPLAEQKEIADIELENLIAKQPVVIDTKKQIDDILLNDLLVTEPVATQTEIADINLSNLKLNQKVILPTEISPVVLDNISTSIVTNTIQRTIADIELSNIVLESITKIQEQITPNFIQLEQGTELLEQPIKEAVYIEKEVPVRVENIVYVPVEINKAFEVVKEVAKYIEIEHYTPAKVIEKDVVKWHDNVSYIELPEQAKTEYVEIQHEVPVEVVKEVNVPVFVEKPVVEQVPVKLEEDKPLITPSDINISFESSSEVDKEEPKEVEPIDVSSDIDGDTNKSNVDSDEEDATVVPIDDDVEEFDDYYDDEEDETPTKSRRKRNTKPYLTLYNGNKPLSSNNIIDKYQLNEETLGTVSQTPKNLKQRKRTKK